MLIADLIKYNKCPNAQYMCIKKQMDFDTNLSG